jgi:hypothetical protein
MTEREQLEPLPEFVPISLASFLLLLAELPTSPELEALVARVEYGEMNNLHVDYLFNGFELAVKLSEKKSMMFKPRRK